MARLKIPKPFPHATDGPDRNGYDQDSPSVDGYVNVVSRLLDNANRDTFVNFVLADEDERADILQELVRGNANDNDWPNLAVFHQYIEVDENQNEVEKVEKIDSANARIKIERDKRKKKKVNSEKPSRYTISLPENRPGERLTYLHEYALAIHELYKTFDRIPDKNHADLIKARQFMFGMMLLTRCR